MHGRKKELNPDKEAQAARNKKYRYYFQLANRALELRAAGDRSPATFELLERLVEVNPDYYTLWNYRRDFFVLYEKEKSPEEFADLCKAELGLIEKAIGRNPKSYCAWFHRTWITARFAVDWKRELALCSKLLDMDSRNFHCWGYRRYVVEQSQTAPEDEYAYTLKKINQNFSNYSAWHQRTKLFPVLFADNSDRHKEELMHDFELVQQAFYTEPDDQSAWLYHRWLLHEATAAGLADGEDSHARLRGAIKQELQTCDELLEIEPDTKWPLLTKALLLRALGELPDEMFEILARLEDIDPPHKQYYADLASGIRIQAAKAPRLELPSSAHISCLAGDLTGVTEIAAAGNRLTHLDADGEFPAVTAIVADSNPIDFADSERTSPIAETFPGLQTLSLRGTRVSSVAGLCIALAGLASLRLINLTETPLAKTADADLVRAKLRECCPTLEAVAL